MARGRSRGWPPAWPLLPDDVELAYATATDVPFLKPAWISRLVELIGEHDLAMPRCDGFHHPLAALYRRRTVLPAIETLLGADRLRPVFLMEALAHPMVLADELREVDPELGTLRNLNTPEDYQAALREAGLDQERRPQAEGHVRRIEIELFGVPRLRAGVCPPHCRGRHPERRSAGIGPHCALASWARCWMAINYTQPTR